MKLTPSSVIWLNGELVPWDKAQIHVLTHALHYASSVFEGIRAYATPRGPAVLGLEEHVDRLFHSSRIVHLAIPYARERIRDAILETVRESGLDACYIRPIVYRGYGALGVGADDCPVDVAIAAFPWMRANERELLEKGLRVGVSSWRRMAPDTLPAMAKVAGNYVNSALVIHEARRHGYDEGLVLDVEGYLSEGSGQNVFVVQGGKLMTPPIGASILPGITRAFVLRLAEDLRVPVVEARIPRELLYTCDEMFFTGTVAEVTPIRSVDGETIASGARGPLTERLQSAFFAIARGEAPDRWRWLTHVRA